MSIEATPNVIVLSRDDILNAPDLQKELVPVPEWGGAVYVQALSGNERDAYEKSIMETKRGRNGRTETNVIYEGIRAKLCARSIVDDEGNRLFTSNDITVLGKKSAAALNRVFEVAQRLSGLSAKDIEELSEELAENPTDGSSSGLNKF